MTTRRLAAATPRRRSQLTLGVLMLWVAVCAAYCWNLKIAFIDHADDVRIIWEDFRR